MAKTPLERKFTQVGELVYVSQASSIMGGEERPGGDEKGPE